jgi:hypothetical protein
MYNWSVAVNFSKKSILTTLFLVFFASSVYASDFCDGFKSGYVTGYKQAKETSLAPLVPLCPLKPLKGFGDPKSDFEFGYTIGFKKGIADGH